jgi:hypothetical protein
MLRETSRFKAKSADGGIFTIVERRKVLIDAFVDGTRQERLGTYEYTLESGDDVSSLSGNEFEIVATGLKLYRI